MAYKKYICLITMFVCCTLLYAAQTYSDDVQFVSGDENTVTLMASATAEKKKDAEVLAMKSAFNCLFHTGVEGLKNGNPILTVVKSDFDYRFFSENRYINYISGEPKTTSDTKIAKNRRVTVLLTINLRTLKGELDRNGQVFSPIWSDAKKETATASLNPSIVIVPYTDEAHGYSFEAMRARVESDNVYRYAIAKVAEVFVANGYKTRDFVAQLQNSKNNEILHEGTQDDVATMMARNLPGDIVVSVGFNVKTNDGTSAVNIELKAIEKQTQGNLAVMTFNSGYYHTTDSTFLVNGAIKKIESSFFTQLSKSFETMVAKGREVHIDMNLSASVSDWDFDQDSPGTGEFFKDALDEWLRENAFGGVSNMDVNTDKYIRITLNVPLWDAERNRSYTLSNFGSALRKFFKAQLGADYKAKITAMGQSIDVIIE